MKIKMLCSVKSVTGEFLARGFEYDVEDERAVEMLNANYALPATPQKKKPEKALKFRD